MSAMPLALLLSTAAATAVGAAALHAVYGLRKQLTALRTELADSRAASGPHPTVPGARTTPDTDEIRAAVAEALAEERERELAEARAFWAAQEARDASDAPSLLSGLPGLHDGIADELFLPRQADFAGIEADSLEPVIEPFADPSFDEFAGESAELAAARRRHPSHPDFVPVQAPPADGYGDHERTVACLEELAGARTALADVRPGPLGTLDVYVFADGTTLCMTPGHRETAELLADALRDGHAPVLLGGSGVSGAYALTFECGTENVYILADRVIASV
ncbi:putative secreted protein [Streptomyces formicae]|uniref:Putative secreted protein n=2 Tax=Streptomyces formicae TaxID=1616117 RepID=A0A291Q9U8_9ACTN|nr:putative secreted protein [Streptomyces formicae]